VFGVWLESMTANVHRQHDNRIPSETYADSYSMKLTDWYVEKSPARKGVYEVLAYRTNYSKPLYSYWDGEWWGMIGDCPAEAAFSAKYKNKFAHPHIWRGVAEKP
jgi:hypothetical protein